jgi:hypothetical protein
LGESPIPSFVDIEGEQYRVSSIGYDGGFDSCCIEEFEIPDSAEILKGFANSSIGRINFSATTTIKQIIVFQCCIFEVLEFPPSVEIIGDIYGGAYSELESSGTFSDLNAKSITFAPGSKMRCLAGFACCKIDSIYLPESLQETSQ